VRDWGGALQKSLTIRLALLSPAGVFFLGGEGAWNQNGTVTITANINTGSLSYGMCGVLQCTTPALTPYRLGFWWWNMEPKQLHHHHHHLQHRVIWLWYTHGDPMHCTCTHVHTCAWEGACTCEAHMAAWHSPSHCSLQACNILKALDCGTNGELSLLSSLKPTLAQGHQAMVHAWWGQ
jgi:hypothetical protein